METYERMSLQEAERQIKRRVEERVRYGESEAPLLLKGKALMALMERALKGEATEADMKPIVGQFGNKYWMRRFYTAVVSWALYSKEYISSVHRLASALGGGKGTLEVCAGSGHGGTIRCRQCPDASTTLGRGKSIVPIVNKP